MKKTIAILGCGRVGGFMAKKMSEKYKVISIDSSQESLDRTGDTVCIKTPITSKFLNDFFEKHGSKIDLVINAMPGHLGFQTAECVLENNKDLVDISFFPEDIKDLDYELKGDSSSARAIFDCGIAPGFSNMILGYYCHNLNLNIQDYTCYVGGLPRERTWPFEYKAGFSPADVLEEYTRPARYIQNNQIITAPALSDKEFLNFDGIGTLEAFNSDGLRSLLSWHEDGQVPNIKEKTMRYPGHAGLMEVFRDLGLFSSETIKVGNQDIKPIDLTSKLLFDKWKFNPGEKDITVLRSIIKTDKKIIQVDLFDEGKDEFETSMARTTGYTCIAAAELLMDGKTKNNLFYKYSYKESGKTPEHLGKTYYQDIVKYLQEQGISIKTTERDI